MKQKLELKSNSKLPENAKLVFKGVIFDTYQWEQEMFDGTIEIFEAIKRAGTVGVIAVTENKKIIMQKEEQPHIGKFLNIPAGRIDKNEEAEDAARRELLEESGCVAKELILFHKFESSSKIIWEGYIFIAKACKKNKGQNLDAGERIENFEVSFKEFIELTQTKEYRDKNFKDLIFRMIHTPGEIKKFKKMLFD